ncbi:MAG: CBS domain-containing protein [Sideroxydans sp.]|jgi:CBS domain-containing protein
MPHHQPQPFVLKTTTQLQEIMEPSNDPWQVDLKDTAVSVMTDFRVRAMFKLTPEETIDEALQKMKVAGLRIAFVKEKGSEKLLGLITSYDILGEKPMRYLQSVGFADRGVTHKDIRVSDIMEYPKDWVVAELHEVEKASVKDVLEALQKIGRSHLPVVERKDGEPPRLRGLFSSAKILRLTETSRQKAAAK